MVVGFLPKSQKMRATVEPSGAQSPGQLPLFFSVREAALHHNPEARKCRFWLVSSYWSEKSAKEISISSSEKVILPE